MSETTHKFAAGDKIRFKFNDLWHEVEVTDIEFDDTGGAIHCYMLSNGMRRTIGYIDGTAELVTPPPPDVLTRLMELKTFLEDVTMPQHLWWEVLDKYGAEYVRVCGLLEDKGEIQKGRQFFISRWATKSEVVQTVFMACLAWYEHEIRESFRFRGQAIFGPHFNVDWLADRMWEAAQQPPETPLHDARQHLEA